MQNNKPLHEINRYEDTAFPVGMYIITKNKIVPAGRGHMDLHWHEELQFTLVTNGSVTMQVDGKTYKLAQGQAIFINRNLLHITSKLPEAGRYISINFPDKLLGFFVGSRMERDYVIPYTNNYCFPAIVFHKEIPWQNEILTELWALHDILLKKNPMYEYRTSQKLVSIWLTLITNAGNQLKIPSKRYVRKQERIQKMLSYIHENYMNTILLKNIAEEASVSEGECCRCFKELIQESPNQYLLRYRISKSMEMLNHTELSVTEIALLCGFNDSSHFIQYFRKKTSMTPNEFRRTHS